MSLGGLHHPGGWGMGGASAFNPMQQPPMDQAITLAQPPQYC